MNIADYNTREPNGIEFKSTEMNKTGQNITELNGV